MLHLKQSSFPNGIELPGTTSSIYNNVTNDQRANSSIRYVPADEWFSHGNRVLYDKRQKKIVHNNPEGNRVDLLSVFRRIERSTVSVDNETWASFLPGWPDGSFGWSKVHQHLADQNIGPKLFVEYVGHGESDKPQNYHYSTSERADLIEALWEAEGITSTFLVCFDYSSIVALELLSRQQDRQDNEVACGTKIEGVLLINGGLFAEAHTHPWYTTPILKSSIGGYVTSLAQHSRLVFGELVKPLWAKSHKVKASEIDELFSAIRRRNGVKSMSRTADFVDHHRQNSHRLNFERLFLSMHDQVSFHVVGTSDDPFEGRQAIVAKERLEKYGLDVQIFPGGHLMTSEQPGRLAQIIAELVHGTKREAIKLSNLQSEG